MSVNITSLTTDRTFSNWVDTTNELITFASTAVTLDSNNAGNIGLTGNITLDSSGQIGTNMIAPVSGDKVTVNSKLQTNDDILIDRSSGDCTLQFKANGTDSFFVKTASTHTALVIGKGTHHITLADNGNITASGRIDNAMLPENISLDGNLTVSSGTSTLSTVTISGGNISGLATLGTADNPVTSAIISSADINGGTIDGTSIGVTTAASGKFTSLEATGALTVGLGDSTIAGNLTVTGSLTATSSIADGLSQTGLNQVYNAIYPIGSLYTTTLSASPGTAGWFLPGDWERYAEGCALVGYDDGVTVSSASVSSGTTTVNTSTAHGFAKGDVVRFSGFTNTNGSFTVKTTPNSTRFTVTRGGASTGGTRKIQLDSARTASSSNADIRGRNSITLTEGQLPAHSHDILSSEVSEVERFSDSRTPVRELLDDTRLDPRTNVTENTGNGDGINVQNRSLIVYVWKRTG